MAAIPVGERVRASQRRHPPRNWVANMKRSGETPRRQAASSSASSLADPPYRLGPWGLFSMQEHSSQHVGGHRPQLTLKSFCIFASRDRSWTRLGTNSRSSRWGRSGILGLSMLQKLGYPLRILYVLATSRHSPPRR